MRSPRACCVTLYGRKLYSERLRSIYQTPPQRINTAFKSVISRLLRWERFSTITNNPARPMDPALVPYTPIIEKRKQKTAMSSPVANGDPTANPVSKEAIKITALQTSIAFLRCVIGPALSTIDKHIAPIDILIPIFS